MTEAWLWPVGLGALGLIFGSFIATVAIRLPEGRSALRGRSACDGCGATLSPAELVPLGSYLLARGRCRRCGAGIDPFHPAIELAGLLVGVAAGVAAPGLSGVAGAVFGWLLLLLAALDLRAFWLPNWATLTLAVAGLAAGLAGLPPELTERAIGGVAGFAVLWLVAAAYRRVRGRDGLGGGDPKLLGAIGLWLGWRALPVLVLSASLIGLIYVALLILIGRRPERTMRLPFGLLLAVAAFPLWWIDAIHAR